MGKVLYIACTLALLITMQTLTVRNIESKSHPETKRLFWFLFAGTRGGLNRVRIVNHLRNKPSNKNQISHDIDLEYKGVEHHMKILEKNNLVTKFGEKYGATYFVSTFFEEEQTVFDEIVSKIKKSGGPEWSR